jgi:two-component system, NtrC family, nitrogen regulation sensor histidine kinase NtrY
MGELKPKPRKTPWVLGLAVLFLFISLVVLQSSNYWRTLFEVTEGDIVLLYALISLNFFAFIVFGFILLRSILKLVRERRALTLGAKLKTRLLLYFTAITILPIVAMAFFSYLFMNRALDRWFTQIPETVAREAREIREQADVDRTERSAAETRMIASAIGTGNVDAAVLSQVAKDGGFAFIAIVDEADKVITSAAGIANVNDAEIRAAIRPNTFDADSRFNVFTAPIKEGKRLIIAADKADGGAVGQLIESSLQEYASLRQQQGTIRQLGLLILGVLTFLLIFASSWMAFYVARGLTAPIMALAEGADHVARGELGYRVETIAEDELEALVNAFNQMSSKLADNAEELAERRRYIETVLYTLPTGVVSVNADYKISTVNPAAVNMLRLGDGELVGKDLVPMLSGADRKVIDQVISRAQRVGHASGQSNIQLESDNKEGGLIAALTASALPENGGVVLVIEDLSELIAAQRAAAWREVARRMAHEIKNPLTPIQLSAERIAKRALAEPEAVAAGLKAAGFDVLPSYSNETASHVIREGTDTIIREVQSLKAMVDEFSQFARMPNVELETGNINRVVEQAAMLYMDRVDDLQLETRIDSTVPETKIDSEQLKRAIVNLIDNAIEAPSSGQEKSIVVSSRCDTARDLVIVEVSDNGKGIEPSDFQKLFQPYFSTKGRGTGLGLAIVQRIVYEHHGKIKAVPNQPNGTKFVIELPLSSQS